MNLCSGLTLNAAQLIFIKPGPQQRSPVDDYSGLADAGAHDQFGNAIAALADYNVAVSVSQSSALANVPSGAARRVDITVTHTSGVIARLSGYRLAY